MSLTAKQLEIRKTGVTATDVVVLAGLSPYDRTPHDVWADKMGIAPPFDETEATGLGLELEPIVLRRVAAKREFHLLKVNPEDLTRRHPDHPHHIATPDAIGATTAFHVPYALAQVKVVGKHAWPLWEAADEEMPDYVFAQCCWELHVHAEAGFVVDYVGALCGTEVRHFEVQADGPGVQDTIGALVEVADQFHADHMLRKQPPPVDGSAGARRMLGALWPRNRGITLSATSDSETLAREYMRARTAEKDAVEAKELAAQGLIALVGDADGITGDGWRLRYELREPAEVAAYTRKAFRAFDLRTKGPRR
jgi:predicted phage-related endonuclease